METTFEKIVRKSGFKPVECKCQVCKTQCKTPCFGTPEDMVNIIAAGYQYRVCVQVINGTQMITPLPDMERGCCTFFRNGLCELHESGLKPTVGKLAHHSTTMDNFNIKKTPSYLVLKEWQTITKERFEKLLKTITR